MAQATLEYMRGEPPSPGSAMSHARANLDSSPKFRRTTEHVRVLARELAAAEAESRTLAERCGRLEAIIDVMAEQARKDARAGPAKQQVDRLEQQLRERNPHDSSWACPGDLPLVSRKPQIFVRTGLTGYRLPTQIFLR